MYTICRLCLADDANFSIFNSPACNIIPIRIMTCSALEVQPDDGLPQIICTNCRLQLEEFYNFRKRCHAADRRLRQHKRLQSIGQASDLFDSEDLVEEGDNVSEGVDSVAASWRRQATQLISTEIEAYKKELLGICKQQVREEIEQEVRNEVEELLLAEARKQCRLNVLDDLFYELERFFIRKRNEAVYDHVNDVSEGFGSDSETVTVERDSDSTVVYSTTTPNCLEPAATEVTPVPDEDANIIELLEDEPSQPNIKLEPPTGRHSPKNLPAAETVGALPMVEINMQANELQHLREDFNGMNYLLTAASVKSTPAQQPAEQQTNVNSPKRRVSHKKVREHLCRKHSYGISRRRQSVGGIVNEPSPSVNCVRCRLRGSVS